MVHFGLIIILNDLRLGNGSPTENSWVEMDWQWLNSPEVVLLSSWWLTAR